MRGDSSYAVLGLRPGAPRAEIDLAYRRLIKRYHPDHAGGDAGRAAEVNRAYTELRSLSRAAAAAAPAAAPRATAAAGSGSAGVALARPGARAGGDGRRGDGRAKRGADGDQRPVVAVRCRRRASRLPRRATRPGEALVFSLDDPISTEMIERSIDDAIGMDVVRNPARRRRIQPRVPEPAEQQPEPALVRLLRRL